MDEKELSILFPDSYGIELGNDEKLTIKEKI